MLNHLDKLFEFIGSVSPPIYVASLAIVVLELAVELVAQRTRRSSRLSIILRSRIERIAADLANTEIRAENSPKATAR